MLHLKTKAPAKAIWERFGAVYCKTTLSWGEGIGEVQSQTQNLNIGNLTLKNV